jgi:hypothetical protein
LKAAVDRIAGLLVREGALILVEFAWDRFDDRTARWAMDHLGGDLLSETPSWLQRLLQEWRGQAVGPTSASIEPCCARWSDAEGLHTSPKMLAELRHRFEERVLEWTPYLYPELPDCGEDEEYAAIRARVINAIGFRYVGTVRPDTHS